jgi:hypothetical protein
MTQTTIDVDSIVNTGDFLREGRYTAHLISAEGQMSRADKPMVVATFVVDKPDESAGLEGRIWFSLAVTEKDGRIFAGGVSEAKRTFAAIGKPLPSKYAFPLDPDAAAKLVAQKLKGVALDIVVTKEARQDVRNDDGTPKYRYPAKIVGAAKAAAVAASDYASFGDDE